MKKFISFIVCFLFLIGTAFAEDEVMGKMSMEGEFLDGNLLKISVVADEMVSPVLGIAFSLNFDDEFLDFLKYEPGEFLERGGDPFYLVKDDISKIIFGETLRRDDDFPVGGGVIANFYFQILTESTYDFSFYNGVVSTLDVVRQDIDTIAWKDNVIGRGDGEVLVDLDYSESSVFGAGVLPWILVFTGCVGVFFVYFLSKK